MIETKNIYYSAYLFSEGLSLANASKDINSGTGDVSVHFQLVGEEDFEQKLSVLYHKGKAKTNIRQYLDSLVKMRNVLFAVLNGKEIKLWEQKRSKNLKR